MQKPTGTFKMATESKRILATLSGNARAAWKRAAISAQIDYEDHKKRAAKSKQKDNTDA